MRLTLQLAQLVEEDVSFGTAHPPRRDGGHSAVIVLVPLARVRVPAEGCVVARVGGAAVVGHADQVVGTGRPRTVCVF